MASPSLLTRSLESLITLGSHRPTSIVIATTSPSAIPTYVFSGLDYLVCGLSRSSVWHSTLRDQLSINILGPQRISGRQFIWSPDSRIYRSSTDTGDRDFECWGESLVTISTMELIRTMPPPPVAIVESNGLGKGRPPHESVEIDKPSTFSISLLEEEGTALLRPKNGLLADPSHRPEKMPPSDFVSLWLYEPCINLTQNH